MIQTVISALLYGFTPALCSFTYRLGNNTVTVTFLRIFLALPLLLGIIKIRKIDIKIDLSTFFKLFVVANLGTLLTNLLLCFSYNYISVGMATMIHFMYPILVVIFCHVFFREIITTRKKQSIGYALIGIAFFLFSSHQGSIIGIGLAFSSSITFALYLTLLDKMKLSEMDGYKLVFYTSLISCFEMLLLNVKLDYIIFRQTWKVYIIMFAVAVLASIVATVFLKEGVRILGSSTASFISLLEPISSIFFGMILLGESISLLQLAGCGAIIISVLNLLVDKRRNV